MNVWLVRAALRTRGLSAGAFRVLLAHADACPPSGRTCLPGLEELAAACELSPQHVLRLRAQLVTAGHLRKLAPAHPGQRPVYEVLPAVPVPVPGTDRTREPQRVAASGRTDAPNGSHRCDPPYKTQGITPPTPRTQPPRTQTGTAGGEKIFQPSGPVPRPDPSQATPPQAPGTEAGALAEATITALRPGQRARIDELGLRRLERAAAPLVAGWSPSDLARRIGAERLDRAENLAAVLCAVLRRYALEPAPRELRAAERAARLAGAAQPPPAPCMHGDPGGCAACSVLPARARQPRRRALRALRPVPSVAAGADRMIALPSQALAPLPAAPAPTGWQQSAACRFDDRDLFFPPEDKRGRYAGFREAAAKQICRSCPVRGECLSYALAADERYGLWGGMTAEQRARLRRARQARRT